MPLYDLMLLLDPTAPSERQDAILKEVTGILDKDGEIVAEQDWGARRMTFEINHRPEAAYHLVQFETQPGGALLERIDHSLKIMDGVLRHRIIRIKDGSPPPPMPRAEGRRESSADYPDAPPVDGAPAAEQAVPAEEQAAPAAGEAAPAVTEQAQPEPAAAEAEPVPSTRESAAEPEQAGPAPDAPAPDAEPPSDPAAA